MPAPSNSTGGTPAAFTAITDCTGSKGIAGQILSSTGTALQWILDCRGTVTSIATGTGLTGGTVTTTGTIALANTAVAPGSYTYGSFTVDAQGRLTAASSGAAPICKSEVLAKGNLIVGTAAGAICALGVGINAQVLTADSACPSGVKWAVAGGGSAATPTVAGTVLGCTTANNAALGCSALFANTIGTNNTAAGHQALRFNDTGCYNTAIGAATLRCNSGGLFNTAVGAGAMCSTTASGNTAVGGNSMVYNTTGCYNTAVGLATLGSNTTGNYNTAVGHKSLSYNTTGRSNTTTGQYALLCNTTGCYNTTVGLAALSNNTTGCRNVGIGPNVTVPSATGSCQLVIGFSAICNWLTGNSTKAIKPGAGIIDCANSCGTAGQVLMSNGANAICWGTASGGSGIPCSCLTGKGDLVTATAASTPTALSPGSDGQVLTACSLCTSGLTWAAAGAGAAATPTTLGTVRGITTLSTALGTDALRCGTFADRNVAVGNSALSCLVSGCFNVALGVGSLLSANNSNFNIGIGTFSMYCAATPFCNIGIGFQTLCCVTTGNNNVAIGHNAMNNRNTACYNVAIGTSASPAGRWSVAIGPESSCNSSGFLNTHLGGLTGQNISGSYNTIVGGCAGYDSTSACNLVLIGFSAQSSTPTTCNEVTIKGGTTLARFAQGATGWSFVSDARLKENVEDLALGLEFIEKVEPRKFNWKVDGLASSGFIAQELEEVVQQFQADHLNLVNKADPDQYSVTSASLIPVLTNAIKELSAEVKLLKAEVAALKDS